MPWEKKPRIKVEVPLAKVGTNLNKSSFTFESLQKLIKGLEKAKYYHTIVFDTVSPEFRDRV